MAALATLTGLPLSSGQAQHDDRPRAELTNTLARPIGPNLDETILAASIEAVSGAPAAGPEKEMSRETQIINRGTTRCTAIAMQSPYQSGYRGAALIQAAMTSCPWHGTPQPYDEYVKAVLAGAREFQKTHPDAN